MKRLAALFFAAVFVGQAAAQSARFDDWFVINADDHSGDIIAGTVTEGGNEILGYRCFVSNGRCVYVLMAQTTCEGTNEYPMLLNSNAGSALVRGACLKTSKQDQLVLQPYKPIESALREGSGMVGFAIPMASGAFLAVRFSVHGGAAAIQEAENKVVQKRRSLGDNPTRPSATTL